MKELFQLLREFFELVKEQLEQTKFLILPHPLNNFDIQKYYQNEPKLNGVYSRDNLPKINDGAYVINLDEHELVGAEWIALYENGDNSTYFDSFRVEHNPKEIKKLIGNKNIMTNIYRMQACDSIMCGRFCIGFIDFIYVKK